MSTVALYVVAALTVLLSAGVGIMLGWFFGQLRNLRMVRGLIDANAKGPAPSDVKAVRLNAYVDVLREFGK